MALLWLNSTLVRLNCTLGEIEDSLIFYKESLQMYLDLGIPVPEWFSKNGYHDVDSDWDFLLMRKSERGPKYPKIGKPMKINTEILSGNHV